MTFWGQPASRWIRQACCLLAWMFSSCMPASRRTSVPVRCVTDAPAAENDHLVVFLRGRSNRPEEFRTWGMFAEARRRWPHARFVAPDLHLAYYYERTSTRRLKEDVIAPARALGKRRVTLIGVSLGGLGALLYELEYPGSVDEIILLSPYLGEEQAWREIAAAGGLAAWQPGPIAPDDFSRKLWQGLHQQWGGPENTTAHVFLACGEDDRFLASNQFFAASFLNPEQTVWLPGGHNWRTWLKAFSALQPSSP